VAKRIVNAPTTLVMPMAGFHLSQRTNTMASNKKTNPEKKNIEKITTDHSVAVDETSIKDHTKLHRLLVDEIPDSVLRRYAIKDHLYYAKDRSKGLAFEDKGKSISAKTSDADDVRAMVELAKAKNWSKIKISGTDEFKKEVWLAARMQGLAVEGYADKSINVKYTPTVAEVAIIATTKAKGAKPKLQASIKQKLRVAVSQLKAMGIAIPKPKIYDIKGQGVGDKTAIDAMDSSAIQKHITQPQVAPRR
jgi:hypothetical protein